MPAGQIGSPRLSVAFAGLLVGLSLFFHSTALAQDDISCSSTPVLIGTHEVVFAGVQYDHQGVGESTWYYCVLSGEQPAISHLTFDLYLTGEGECQSIRAGSQDVGIWRTLPDDVIPGAGSPTIGRDATTEIYGLKFGDGSS